jgi:hypothetical protein
MLGWTSNNKKLSMEVVQAPSQPKLMLEKDDWGVHRAKSKSILQVTFRGCSGSGVGPSFLRSKT